MKMNKGHISMMEPSLMDDNNGIPDDSDIPLIQEVNEFTDEHGDHVIVTFDDGTKAHHHTHGILDEEYHDGVMTSLQLVKKAQHWMKNNLWKNQKVDIGMMMETSLMLGSVSKMLHTTATCISSDETERCSND
jgi:hypothetical protein